MAGLIAEGAQGMRTGNNGRFLGYLEGTYQAAALVQKRAAWTKLWLANAEIATRFRALLEAAGGDSSAPLEQNAAWEAAAEALRAEFSATQLGFGKTDLYRIVPRALLADENDLVFTWQERKKELWQRWRTLSELEQFWTHEPPEIVSDEEFCTVCSELQTWIAAENASRKIAQELEQAPVYHRAGAQAVTYQNPDDCLQVIEGALNWEAEKLYDVEGLGPFDEF